MNLGGDTGGAVGGDAGGAPAVEQLLVVAVGLC